jgi:hypothetical protein
MFLVKCDRCGVLSGPVEIEPMPVEERVATALRTPGWLYPTPKGWNRVFGKIICVACVAAVENLLANPFPRPSL